MASTLVLRWRDPDPQGGPLSLRGSTVFLAATFLLVGVIGFIPLALILGGISLFFVIAMDNAHAHHLAAEERIRKSNVKVDPFVRDVVWPLEKRLQRKPTKKELDWYRSAWDLLNGDLDDPEDVANISKMIESAVDTGIHYNDVFLYDLKNILTWIPIRDVTDILYSDTYDQDVLDGMLKGLSRDQLTDICSEIGFVFQYPDYPPDEDALRQLIWEFRNYDEKKRKEDAFNRNNFQPDFGSISIAKKEKIWQINNDCSNCYKDRIDVSFYWTLHPKLEIILLCDKCASEMDLLKEGEVESERKSRRISDEVKNNVWRRDDGRCTKCGSKENLEFDHIIPHSKGGSNTVRNIQLLCESCNRSKSASI